MTFDFIETMDTIAKGIAFLCSPIWVPFWILGKIVEHFEWKWSVRNE